MHARKVAKAIHHEVTDANMQIFRQRYLRTDYASVSSVDFRRAMELAQNLSGPDQEILLEIIRQVSVDTASTVLGIFEGTIAPEGLDSEIAVIYDDEDISDEVQTLFLITEEEYRESRAKD